MRKTEIFEVVVNYVWGAYGNSTEPNLTPRRFNSLPRRERTFFVILPTPNYGSIFINDGSEAFSQVRKILMADSEENIKLHLAPYEDIRIQSIRQVAKDAETIIVE